jgi:DNA-binding transcriptional LysR family regulator
MTVIREIMRTGSVSGAARTLGRTQPALSAAVKEMEKRLDFQLFTRENGRLQPAPETYFLLQRAEEIIGQVEHLEQMMRTGGAATAAKIAVISMPVLSEHFLPGVIATFTTNHPQAGFHLAVERSADVLAAMEAQRFDVGLAESGQTNNLVNCRQFEVPCVCALPGDDPLLAKRFITPADLAGRACVSSLPNHHIARAVRVAFDEAGVPLNPKFEMQNGAAQIEIIGVGAGFGVFSSLNAWNHRRLWPESQRLAFRRFVPEVSYQFSIITPTRRPLSQVATAFAEKLERDVIETLNEAEKLINSETG